MARDIITINEISAEGAQKSEDLTWTAMIAANDLQVLNDGNINLIIKNGGAAPQDVTFISVASVYGRTQDLTISTTNAKESVSGKFPPRLWNQTDGYLHIDSATEDSLEIAAIRQLV